MADNGNNSSDDGKERPHDWEMLSLSLSSLTDCNPSGGATPGQEAEAGAGPSSTGSCPKEPQGISEEQVQSKYYELPSPSFSRNSEKGKTVLPSLEDGGTNADGGGSGSIAGKEESSFAAEGSVPGEAPEENCSLDDTENKGLAHIQRDIPAEPKDTYSKIFEEANTKLTTEDVSPASVSLIPEVSKKPKLKKTWWKQQVENVSQTGALWSLALAAAVVGIVILGRGWHHEHLQNQQLRLQLGSKDEKINQLLSQISRLKDVVSGRQRVSVLQL